MTNDSIEEDFPVTLLSEYSFIEVLPQKVFFLRRNVKENKHRSASKTENKTVDTRLTHIDF